MAILTETSRKAEFMVSAANAYRSLDEGTITVPANTTLEAGTVMEIDTGKFVRLNIGDEAGILFQPLTNATGSAVDMKGTIVARDAEVHGDKLTYASGANAGAITASNTALAALGIIVR